MILRRCLLVVGLAGCTALSSCGGHACSLVGCAGSLSLRLDRADGSLVADGRYQVQVREGDFTQLIEFVRTMGRIDSMEGASVMPSGQGLVIDTRGHTYTADRLEISVTIDGNLRTTSDAPVAYTFYELNGPGCGPPCQNGQTEVKLP